MNKLSTLPNSKMDQEIEHLKSKYIDIIKSRLGIVIQSHQAYDLLKVIHEACEKFDCTPEEYLSSLTNCPHQSPLLNHLISGVTVGETYFFRDQQQMDLLQNELLPEIIATKRKENNLSIRIWSAGCASGEEIYTVAILLVELIPDIQNWTIKLLGTDINTHSLKKAIKGCYSEWSMRSITNYFKDKYFDQLNKNYQLNKTVQNLVTFDYLNLNDDSYPSIFNGTNSQDLILCRNVLIYFDAASCNDLMRRLNASLLMGGYLILGASDPINVTDINFIFHHQKGLLFSKSATPQHTKIASVNITIPTEITLPKKPIAKKIHKTPTIPAPKTLVMDNVSHQSLSEKAIEFANKGKLEEALKLCEQGFQKDPTNKMHYFTYALTLLELNKIDEAESAFRKTLFLDNQFVAGHFQLGLLLLRKKQYTSGLKYLHNSIKIAETKNPEEPVLGSPGLSYQKLAEILRNEIKLYQVTGVNHED